MQKDGPPKGPAAIYLQAAEDLLAGVKQEVAQAIGITPSRYSRVRSGKSGVLNPLNCLRLARLVGTDPDAVLRACQKGEMADLISELYGPRQLVGDDAEIDRVWRLLSDDDETRDSLLQLARTALRETRPIVAPRDRRSGGSRFRRSE